MYTRLKSANLDFDSELQHVFCWAPDECRDFRVFHVDRVFLLFVERCSRVWLGCIERYPWLAVLTRTHFFLVMVCCSPGSRGNSRVFGVVAVWSTAVDICWTRGSEHLCIFVVFFALCFVSVSVFGTIQRGIACPCVGVDIHQPISVAKFYVAQFQRCCVSFSSVSSQGSVFLHSCSQLRTRLADH